MACLKDAFAQYLAWLAGGDSSRTHVLTAQLISGGLWKAVTLLLGISTREHCRIFLPLYTYNQGDLVRTFKTSCMASWFQHSVTKNPLLSHFTIGDLYRLTGRGNSCKT